MQEVHTLKRLTISRRMTTTHRRGAPDRRGLVASRAVVAFTVAFTALLPLDAALAQTVSPSPSPSPSTSPSASTSPSPAAAGEVLSAFRIADGVGGLPAGTLQNLNNWGDSISALPDIDGNGVNDLAVFCIFCSRGAARSGSISILFMHANGTVKSTQAISATQGGANLTATVDGRFGASTVGFMQPMGHDGHLARLAVGEFQADVDFNNAGRMFLFRLFPNGTVAHQVEYTNGVNGFPLGELSAGDVLGRSLADLGDVDGDGLLDLAAGASYHDAGVTNGGAIFVLFLAADDTIGSYVRLSQATGEGFDFLGVANQELGVALAAIPPRTAGNPVDLAVGSADAAFIVRLATNGSILGQPEEISDGKGGMPSGTSVRFD